MKNFAIVFLSAVSLVLSVLVIARGKSDRAGSPGRGEWTARNDGKGNLAVDAFGTAGNVVVTPQRFFAFGDGEIPESGLVFRIVYRNGFSASAIDDEKTMLSDDTSGMLLDWTGDLLREACGDDSRDTLLEYYRKGMFADMISQLLGKKLEEFVSAYNAENGDDDTRMDVEVLAVEMIANDALRKELEKKDF